MSLQATFQTLCAIYFPRWRAASQWTIRAGARAQWRRGTSTTRTSEQGYCDPLTKTLWINASSQHRAAVIIHECCHAVTTGGHARAWQARMRQAQQCAAARGETALAAALAADVDGYTTPDESLTAGVVYARVLDILLDVPSATLDRVVDAMAYDYGMTPDEVLHRYRRLPYWYARHRREEIAAARAQLQAASHAGMGAAMLDHARARLEALTHEPGGDR